METAENAPKKRQLYQFIHHSQFSKQEKQEGVLSQNVKQCMLEQGHKVKNYTSDKVYTRTETRYTAQDPKKAQLEKERRMEDVFKCGFCSDPKEPYKTLGELYLDSDALIYHYLELDPQSSQKTMKQSHHETVHKVQSEQHKDTLPMTTAKAQAVNDGFQSIKCKLDGSHARIHAVKFGIPFLDFLDQTETKNQKVVVVTKKHIPSTTIPGLDWGSLKMDTEKQNYYSNMYERRIASEKRLETRHAEADELSGNKSSRPTTQHSSRPTTQHSSRPTTQHSSRPTTQHSQGSQPQRPATHHGKSSSPTTTLLPRPKTQQSVFPQGGIKIGDTTYSDMKSMEDALHIRNGGRGMECTNQYLANRDKFTEQRHRLSNLLQEDLGRMDHSRRKMYQRKYVNFHISKKNLGFMQDMNYMRLKAEQEWQTEKGQHVANHAWFHDLVNKVHMTGGMKRTLSHFEHVLIERIRGIIEDQLPFDHSAFVSLLKVIPSHEFTKDEIQRIIRYVKQHESITEKEYVEAIEKAGHSI